MTTKTPLKNRLLLGVAILSSALTLVVIIKDRLFDPSKVDQIGVTININGDSPLVKDYKSRTVNKNGVENGALLFNGVDQYLMIDSEPTDILSDFTFSFWVNPEKKGMPQVLFLKGENCPDGNPNFKGLSYMISLSDVNSVQMTIYSGKGNHTDEYISLNSKEPLAVNAWSSITILFDHHSKKFTYFLNGKKSDCQTVYKTNPNDFTTIHQSQSPLKIGADENYCNYLHQFSMYFKGGIDEIRIYNRLLSEYEVARAAGLKPLVPYLRSWLLAYIIVIITVAYIFFKKNIREKYKQLVLVFDADGLPNEKQKKRLSILLISTASLITILTGLLYFQIFSTQAAFDDTAFFGGDTWEYQSMAVNYAKGYGIQKFGGLEDFESYKFDHHDPSIAAAFVEDKGMFNAYRTPLYPIFLGTIYKFSGISPAVAKKIQLILLIIISTCLPWIGYYYWHKTGLITGCVSGFLFLMANYDMADQILAEAFFSFLIFLMVVAFIFYEKKKNIIASIGLGLTVGLALLTKGNLLFVPLFLTLHFAMSYVKSKDRTVIRNGLLFLITFLITISVWSVFASLKTHSFVILSTQAKTVLLDCNNEYCADGGWHPEWRKDQASTSFYKNDQMDGRSSILRVINFYLAHLAISPTIIFHKISRGFNSFVFLTMTILSLLSVWLQMRTNQDLVKSTIQEFLVLPSFLIIICVLFANYFGLFKSSFTAGVPIQVSMIVILLILMFQRRLEYYSPLIFNILFLNFLVMTIISFGEPRYIKVIDFVFTLWGTHSLVAAIKGFYNGSYLKSE